jgi:hypothetical protein
MPLNAQASVDWDWACRSELAGLLRACRTRLGRPALPGVRSGGLRQEDVADLVGLSLRRYAIHIRPREKAVLGILLLHAGMPCSNDMLLEDCLGR